MIRDFGAPRPVRRDRERARHRLAADGRVRRHYRRPGRGGAAQPLLSDPAAQVLSFFSGTRFVPIVSAAVYLPVGIAMYFIWPAVQSGINALGAFVLASGYAGTWLYGFIERALIPFGLHHVFLISVLADRAGRHRYGRRHAGRGRAEHLFRGAGDTGHPALLSPRATRFMAGKFPLMIFGLPGAALALYRCARPENRKAAGGLLLSARAHLHAYRHHRTARVHLPVRRPGALCHALRPCGRVLYADAHAERRRGG